MAFDALLGILAHEGIDFDRNLRWKPKGLVPDIYRQSILKTIRGRLSRLEAAEAEFQQLDRATLYLNALKRMRFAFRQAQFAWRVDDLKFLEHITEFFSEYGTVLRHLQWDKGRGRLGTSSVGV